MRPLLFKFWAGFRALLAIFVVAPALLCPADVRPTDPKLPAIHSWEGLSSWYGPRFHGRVTANGEIYDMYAATAAHVSLPLGSLVRVTNPHTGQSKVVRINDRGPYIEGREIDLSFQVARELGLVERGVARVKLELLRAPQNGAQYARGGPQRVNNRGL